MEKMSQSSSEAKGNLLFPTIEFKEKLAFPGHTEGKDKYNSSVDKSVINMWP